MNRRGFALMEVVVALGVFVLFAVGIYGGIQFVFKSVYQSRLRIIETNILNEQMEIVRNISFFDIGIVNGIPNGTLERIVTTTHNGIDFTITRTVRNIDDPYDGTVGGNPNDLAPADYKLVDIAVMCDTCGQQKAVSLTSQFAPKNLEGDPNNGALFIQVFDANAAPVQGATVHVYATSTGSLIDVYDTTDNDGMLRLVDVAQGIGAYHVTVSKSGYTTDKTVTSSATIFNPVKPPASVVAQSVTQVSFAIDEVSALDISTINNVCVAVPNASIDVAGTRLIGTTPDVFIVSTTVSMNGSGIYTFSQLPWDAYGLTANGYDLLGSIPAVPVTLGPGVTQPVQLVLGQNTTHSLLVNVSDSITGQSISDAVVTVTSSGYSQTLNTGIGFVRQTDWSGGSGQLTIGDDMRYWVDDGNVETSNQAGDLHLRLVGPTYVSAGELESSIFDLGTPVNFVNLIWEPLSQPIESGNDPLRFQLATSNTSTPPSWEYLGPDGTASTFYTVSNPVINAIHDNDQYVRYKVYLSSDTTTTTPTLSDISVTYTTSCTPPGQAYFGNLTNQSYGIEVTKSGYQTYTDTVTVIGDILMSVSLISQ